MGDRVIGNRLTVGKNLDRRGSVIVGVSESSTGGEAFAYKAALIGSTGFLLVALLFSLRIRDADAAAAMRKPTPVQKSAEPAISSVSKT